MPKLTFRDWIGILILCILLLILEYIVFSFAYMAAFGMIAGEMDTFLRVIKIVMALTLAAGIIAGICAVKAKQEESGSDGGHS